MSIIQINALARIANAYGQLVIDAELATLYVAPQVLLGEGWFSSRNDLLSRLYCTPGITTMSVDDYVAQGRATRHYRNAYSLAAQAQWVTPQIDELAQLIITSSDITVLTNLGQRLNGRSLYGLYPLKE